MSKILVSLLSIILLNSSAWAASAKMEVLQGVTKKYRSAKLVEMNVEKSVKSDLLNKTSVYSGKIYLASGKFRWENSKPEKSLLLFDGETIWSEQSPPEGFGGPIQVARGKVDRKTKSHILLATLLGADLKKNFKVIDDSKKDGALVFLEIQPLSEDLNIKKMSLVVDTKENILQKVSYKDEIGNETSLLFSNVVFLKSEKKELFKYKRPKGAVDTQL